MIATEYWKSQARKYCEFCKCWFADNKVSISFHENGKRHKESVQKHISQLTKKSTKDAKHKEKIDDDMKRMETAAMAAYLKDVQNNADITSQSINEMLGQSSDTTTNVTVSTAGNTSKKPPVWHEVKNDDGSSYFWNTESNETTWDPPDEYVSAAQLAEKKLKVQTKEKKKQKLIQKEKQKESFKEAKAFLAREQMKSLAVAKDPPPVRTASFGPEPRAAKPYGTWAPVVNEPTQNLDLQLPKPDKVAAPPPVIMEPETVVFKERRVESLGEGPVEFKKRKLKSHRRNLRRKLDDD